MNKLTMIMIVAVAALTGCSTVTKTRSLDLAGLYASETGQLALGRIEVQAIPEGTEAALIKYSEDNAWLQPSMKLHEIGITLTGTNSVAEASGIVEAICRAFIAVAPSVTNDVSGATLHEQQTERFKVKEAARAVKSAAGTDTTAASSASASACGECTDGSCDACKEASACSECANGACSPGT